MKNFIRCIALSLMISFGLLQPIVVHAKKKHPVKKVVVKKTKSADRFALLNE